MGKGQRSVLFGLEPVELAYQIWILDLKWDFSHPAVRWWGNCQFLLCWESQASGPPSYPDVCFCEYGLSWCIHLDQSLVQWGLNSEVWHKIWGGSQKKYGCFREEDGIIWTPALSLRVQGLNRNFVPRNINVCHADPCTWADFPKSNSSV